MTAPKGSVETLDGSQRDRDDMNFKPPGCSLDTDVSELSSIARPPQ